MKVQRLIKRATRRVPWPKVRHYSIEAATIAAILCALLCILAATALALRVVWEALTFGWRLVG